MTSAQHLLVELADAGLRNLVDERPSFWQAELGSAVREPTTQFFCGDVRVGLANDTCQRSFIPAFVGDTDDSGKKIKRRGLTIRSTGPIAAGRHLGYKSLAQIPARRNRPVSSNVRPHRSQTVAHHLRRRQNSRIRIFRQDFLAPNERPAEAYRAAF